MNILNKNKIKPILLHGFQSYPTKVENSDLGKKLIFSGRYLIISVIMAIKIIFPPIINLIIFHH